MQLIDQLKQDRINAMKQKDQFKRDTLSTLIGDLQTNQKKENNDLTDAVVVQAIKKALQNAEENYKLTNDTKFKDEAELYEQYLPTQMDQQQLTDTIKEIIEQNDNPTIGVVMKELKTKYDGQFDGKLASSIVKQQLN